MLSKEFLSSVEYDNCGSAYSCSTLKRTMALLQRSAFITKIL